MSCSFQRFDSPSSTDRDRPCLGYCSVDSLSGPWTQSCVVLLDVVVFSPPDRLSAVGLYLWCRVCPQINTTLKKKTKKLHRLPHPVTTMTHQHYSSIVMLISSPLAVAHAQDTHHHSTEKPLIQCYKCGEPCKGEVLRVQNKHFHLKCFTCKGTVTYSWIMQIINKVLKCLSLVFVIWLSLTRRETTLILSSNKQVFDK